MAVSALSAPAADAGGKRGQATRSDKVRIVVQVNEDDVKRWNSILGNLHNIRTEFGAGGAEIAVVAIGPGLAMLHADSLVANRVEDAMAEGVQFIACENTMKAQNLKRDDLVDKIGFARAGYVEIVRRQRQGWSYLRP